MSKISLDAGSFRDTAGQVFHSDGRVFRSVVGNAQDEVRSLLSSAVWQKWNLEKKAVATREIARAELPGNDAQEFPPGVIFLEHERIDFISYPYEWPFALLKKAAVLQLDLHLDALESGFTFIDASAYNFQFVGSNPVLIDVLSVRRYQPRGFWTGYRQFCEQFLNPLLLTSKAGVPFNAWYRGGQEGIRSEELSRLLPIISKLSWRTLMHVELHARLEASARNAEKDLPAVRTNKMSGLSLEALQSMLRGLRTWVSHLEPKGHGATIWRDYERKNSYEIEERALKQDFISAYSSSQRPALIWDLGCNSGEYSEAAIASGVQQVIGFDTDLGALDAAVSRASERNLNFLPLLMDATNPSPDQGWQQRERLGLAARRGSAQGVLALAFLHHLVLGRNIPLEQGLSWILEIAPGGVIEFVPKCDPMIQFMLRDREDVFFDYGVERFLQIVKSQANIIKEKIVSKSGRLLVQYAR